jgi:hypothetical protein
MRWRLAPRRRLPLREDNARRQPTQREPRSRFPLAKNLRAQSPVKNPESPGLLGFPAGLKYSLLPVWAASRRINLQIETAAEA